MMARFVPALCLLSIGLTGCLRMNSNAKIDQAADLVGQQTGHRPEWSVPWDAEPPAWDGQSILTLDTALVMALRNNRDLRADLELIGQANSDLVQAGLMTNPVINFMIMFPSGGGRSMLRGGGLPMQPLQDLWLIPARKKVAETQLQQVVLRVADDAVAVAADVKKVYTRLKCTQRTIELIRENMQVVEQTAEIIRTRQAAGQASQVDFNLARIRRLKLQSELLRMEAELRRGQRELLMLMGVAAASDGWRVEPVAEISDALENFGEETALVALAADQRLDVKAAEWQAEAAAAGLKLAKHEALPEISLGLSLERSPAPRSNNQSWRGRAANTAVRGLADRMNGVPSGTMMHESGSQPKKREVEWTIGPELEMEIPIFDQGQGRIGRAYHEYRQRIAEYEAKLQEVTRTVRETLIMYRQAHDQIRFYRDSIMPEVERNLTLARQSYTAGQDSLTVFLAAQEDLIATRLKIVDYCREYALQRAELERQVGGRLGLPEPAATQPSTQP